MMRDMATYESNFSEFSGLRLAMLKIHKVVMSTKVHLEKDINNKNRSWIDLQNKNQIHKHLEELNALKKERSNIAELSSMPDQTAYKFPKSK